MIPLAYDDSRETRLLQGLKTLWFIAAATALPAYDFIRSSSRLSLAGALLGALFLVALIGTHCYIVRSGPALLSYEERFRDLLIHTALQRYEIPIRQVTKVSLLAGAKLRYRHGVSVRGYHVGTFVAAGIGPVRVAASSLSGTGLLVEYRSARPFTARKARLYLSPDEPLAVKLALEDLIAENRQRVALGQP